MTGAVLVLAVFAVFAALMYRRIVPALVAVPCMAIAMSAAAGVPFAHWGAIFTGGAVALAPVYAAVIFGALLGRVTLDTGIARAIVNLAAEYGGERPMTLALALCAIVAVLFVSLSGLGAIIMVGSIVLPIMMTAGVPRTVAATMFLMAFALGFIFNIANWTFYTSTFGVTQAELVRYAIVLAAADAFALIVYAAVAFARERQYAAWAVRARPAPGEEASRVPAIALIVPLLPLLLYFAPGLHVQAVPAFAIAAVAGALLTRPRDAVQTLVAAAIRGVEDVAPAILLFVGIGMLVTAVAEPQFRTALAPLVGGGWAGNPIAYVLVFGLASPLALYRGPLNPFGVGIAIFLVLLSSHALPAVVLVAAIMAVVQVQNVCDPTNTANVWVANFTGVPIATITRRTLPFQVAVATLGTVAVAIASPALFGLRPFAAFVPPAYAGAIGARGFYARASASDRIGVANDGTPLGGAAAGAVVDALSSAGLKAFGVAPVQPDATDCSDKPYAAFVQVTTSRFALIEGVDFDVGLRLEDCGGWIVDEWHDHRVYPSGPQAADARRLGREGAARLQDWASGDPVRSAELFADGVAAAAGDPPTYFYAFFKTVDGNMRVYVRGGGPAYAAGLRSGDVVEKLDGKPWWEYGTYQTEMRAYDGRPHAIEIEREGRTIDVTLGEPFHA
ncbi:MAG TPA: hypothetical protein VMF61_14615 [Candidatus Acidoferrales bacterium]|nr:hypothetical protein [Candidatus Acidoferrales bacterium]